MSKRLEYRFSVSQDYLSRELAEVLRRERPHMPIKRCSELAREAIERIKRNGEKALYSGLILYSKEVVKEILGEQ